MLVKDTWAALWLRVLSSALSGIRVSPNFAGKITDRRNRNPMKSKGQKQGSHIMIGKDWQEGKRDTAGHGDPAASLA
jgi:hypothetical protein